MQLHLLLPEGLILSPFESDSATKEGILRALVRRLLESGCYEESKELDENTLLEALLERESQQSTAVGEGFAFPHARLENLKGFYMILAVCPAGLDFGAPDGSKINFFVLTLVPRTQSNLLLNTRAAVLRFLASDERRAFCMTHSPAEIYRELVSADITLEQRILASDVMQVLPYMLTPEMTLEEAARQLHLAKNDALPIVDKDGCFRGEFTCRDLFEFGIPKFFQTLYGISYVRDMNPFEKYFMTDRTQKIGDLVPEHPVSVLPPDATIMEIIFEMTTHNHQQVYIVDENKHLCGCIDRYTIVDKILISNV